MVSRTFWVLVTRIAIVAGLDDLVFAAYFAAEHAPSQVVMNLCSAGIYAIVYLSLKRRRNQLAIGLIWAEVFGHATIGTMMLGWNSGYFFYFLMFVPMIVISVPRRQAYPLVVALWGYFIALMVAASWIRPTARVSPGALLFLEAYNATVVIGMVTAFTLMYRRLTGVAEQKLKQLATTDPLSGLFNRRHAMAVIARCVADLERFGRPLSFILADIDSFKAINDRYGHDAGDRVLIAVARAISEMIRTDDSLARWGGEEFLAILPSTTIEGAYNLAERFQQRLGQLTLDLAGNETTVTITIGISSQRQGEPFEAAMARADAALYKGKHAGRNCIMLETPPG